MKLTEILRGHTRQTVSANWNGFGLCWEWIGCQIQLQLWACGCVGEPKPGGSAHLRPVGAVGGCTGTAARSTGCCHPLPHPTEPARRPAGHYGILYQLKIHGNHKQITQSLQFKSTKYPICDNSHSFSWNQLLPWLTDEYYHLHWLAMKLSNL